MGLQAKYDPREDRMWLTLHRDEGVSYEFWVSRRQWLGLLKTVASLPTVDRAPDTVLPLHPRRLSAKGAAVSTRVHLQGIRLRRLAVGVRLMFITDEASVGVDLPAVGVAQLLAMLQEQAERAGWDAASALARLEAVAMTDTALKRAQQLH